MDLNHHITRVRQELDLAYRASSDAASAAHFRLAALHMREVDVYSGTAPRTTSEMMPPAPPAARAVPQTVA
jgi:hypothetical protein